MLVLFHSKKHKKVSPHQKIYTDFLKILAQKITAHSGLAYQIPFT
ncbi:MAG: hypothetical protein ACI9XO_000297 [Paraglaciecola sp.]|jgi:hypothetical protein